ncbi:ash family protein [Gibbsiella quercinecans]|uniref:ash family protein n=1 Tax=Gibbsiella quercinecans TaxID=929813 RepID=UPI0039B4B4B2
MYVVGDSRRAMRLFIVVALSTRGTYRAESMVALAGQPSGWPVSDNAGTANSVWATTN